MKALICFFALTAAAMQLRSQDPYISDLPLDNIEILDDVVSEYQVFFTGENHFYTSENTNIKLKMLKYLNKKAGVRNLILELGFARGYMLNKYINDDSSYYDLMRYTTSIYFLEMYKELRVLNQALPPDERVTVHGIDVERFADDGPVMLAKLLPERTEVPAPIEFSVEVIRSYGAYSMKRYQDRNFNFKDDEELYIDGFTIERGFFDAKTIDTMVADYRLNKEYFRQYLGENFALFDQVFNSIIEYRKYMNFENMPHQYVYRERMIYDNLSKLMKENPDEKYYGQFGRCHISQTQLNQECEWWAFSSVAKRLNEGSARDKVLSIGIFYNGKKMSRFYNETYFDDYQTTLELQKYLDVDCSNSNILTRIDRKDTGLVKHYQYMIYNNPCGAKKKRGLEKDVDDYHEWAFMIDFGYGQADFDLKNLNGILRPDAGKFNERMSFYSFGWSHNDFGAYNHSSLKWFPKQQVSSGPVKYTLSGYSATQSIGWMPHISGRFAFGLYGSFGLNRLSLKVENDSAALSLSPGFSSVNRIKYINNGLVLGGGLDLRFAFTHWLGIYVRGTYLYDVSKKYWKQADGWRNIADKASPKTPVGYIGLSGGLSLLIQE